MGNRQPDLAERFLEIIGLFVPLVGYILQELMKERGVERFATCLSAMSNVEWSEVERSK